ncbi:hypothetical protein E2C01_048422 [Portunus trituberculatus]|uniref:Uncharacterized protein n=1 Tax=Portunus trituberculatus TaxID=210409 RepID=A0A5B7GB39_PORTR|nr:hypothetical protein [Portunus trituberculatus]
MVFRSLCDVTFYQVGNPTRCGPDNTPHTHSHTIHIINLVAPYSKKGKSCGPPYYPEGAKARNTCPYTSTARPGTKHWLTPGLIFDKVNK